MASHPDDQDCPQGGKHAWVNLSALRVCRSVQVPGLNPATHSTTGDCAKCGVHRIVRNAYPSTELEVIDR